MLKYRWVASDIRCRIVVFVFDLLWIDGFSNGCIYRSGETFWNNICWFISPILLLENDETTWNGFELHEWNLTELLASISKIDVFLNLFNLSSDISFFHSICFCIDWLDIYNNYEDCIVMKQKILVGFQFKVFYRHKLLKKCKYNIDLFLSPRASKNTTDQFLYWK